MSSAEPEKNGPSAPPSLHAQNINENGDGDNRPHFKGGTCAPDKHDAVASGRMHEENRAGHDDEQVEREEKDFDGHSVILCLERNGGVSIRLPP